MKKFFFLMATMCLPFFMLTSCSKDDDSDDDSGRPSWNNPEKLSVTGDVTDITAFGATISGWANINPMLIVSANFGIIVSKDSNPSYSNGMQYSTDELKSDNSYQVSVTNLTPGTKYYYLSYVKIGDIYTYGDVRSFSTIELHLCPDDHHPHAIDLGMPSGTKWCCCNVGASIPEGYGGYYAWGETSEKSVYNEVTNKYFNGSDTNGDGFIDTNFSVVNIGSNIAGTQYDVAHVRMGGSWCMPNDYQIDELINNCTRKWTNHNGVNGILVTGKNGSSVFLPAAGGRWYDNLDDVGSYGVYWSSSLNSSDDGNAYGLSFFGSGGWDWGYYDYRNDGLSVRAVCP